MSNTWQVKRESEKKTENICVTFERRSKEDPFFHDRKNLRLVELPSIKVHLFSKRGLVVAMTKQGHSTDQVNDHQKHQKRHPTSLPQTIATHTCFLNQLDIEVH